MGQRARLMLTGAAIILSFLAVAAALSLARGQNRYGCGLNGGPGLRASAGHCVGWGEVARVCGEPPYTGRCEEETDAAAPAPCKGCGCKGGPGYRAPDGKCVGWAALKRTCGDPPTLACTPEGPALKQPTNGR